MDFKDVIKIILHKMKFIVIFPVVFVMAVSCYVYLVQKPCYTSTAVLYLLPTGDFVSDADIGYAEKMIHDYVLLAQNSDVQANAAQALGEDSIALYDVQVVPDGKAHAILISATAENPAVAANVANAYSGCAVAYLREAVHADGVSVLESAKPADAPDNAGARLRAVVLSGVIGLAAGVIVVLLVAVVTDRPEHTRDKERLPAADDAASGE